jgi:hypothetical protein
MKFWIHSVLALSAIPLGWALPNHLPSHFGSSDISQGEERASQETKRLDLDNTVALWKRKDATYQPVHSEPISDLEEDGNFTVIAPPKRPRSAPFMSFLDNMKSWEDEEEYTAVKEVLKELMERAGTRRPMEE